MRAGGRWAEDHQEQAREIARKASEAVASVSFEEEVRWGTLVRSSLFAPAPCPPPCRQRTHLEDASGIPIHFKSGSEASLASTLTDTFPCQRPCLARFPAPCRLVPVLLW
eukprot:2487987-Pyramimonas_sp.AAC.1